MNDTLWSHERDTVNSWMTEEDWLNQGKSDAWAGKPKSSPENDVIAASMYDLGYSEGSIKHSPKYSPTTLDCRQQEGYLRSDDETQ